MTMYRLLRPLLFALDAEDAHRLTIAALKRWPERAPSFDPVLASKVAGLRFPSPVGLAAGFDKDAEVPGAMLGLGFGFVEVGTLTPRAQDGNPRPRLFRLAEDGAVINRMGFNNRGQAAARERLATHERRGPSALLRTGIVGVNIGVNKDSNDRVGDYARGIAAMAPVADYLAVNISSPNTAGLRNLQDAGELEALLGAVRDARVAGGPPSPDTASGPRPAAPPVFLKVAPDLQPGDHGRIVRAALDHGVDALIVANTTVTRPPLRSRHGDQAGGLSGQPLAPLALDQLRRFRAESGGTLPLIAAGGIASAADAWERLAAGASLVQLYSALVYHGPGLPRRINAGLAERLRQRGMANIAEAVGSE